MDITGEVVAAALDIQFGEVVEAKVVVVVALLVLLMEDVVTTMAKLVAAVILALKPTSQGEMPGKVQEVAVVAEATITPTTKVAMAAQVL
jgi:hypothetical protein